MRYKRIKIKIGFLSPGMSFLYPLYSENGKVILEPRIFLTKEMIKEFKGLYGDILYYEIPDTSNSLIERTMKKAAGESEDILAEISKTDKLSEAGFKKAERVVEDFLSELESVELRAINLLKDLKSFDIYQYQHQVNVGMMASIFARKMGRLTMDEIKNLTLGAFLIDIGKMRIDKQLLHKEGTYDISEMQKIRRHPQLGYELLKDIAKVSPIVLQTVLFHHEKFNNRGYYGLPYKNLPIFPKIAGVCDIYDALTSRRPHRQAYDTDISLKYIVNTINSQFDYKLVSNFINHLGPLLNQVKNFYSRGDFCELNTDEIALIKDFTPKDYLKPVIFIFCKFERNWTKLQVKFFKKPIEVNLQKDTNRYITKMLTNAQQIEAIRRNMTWRGMLIEYL